MTVNNSLCLINERAIGGRLTTSLAIKKGRCRWELIRDILKATLEDKKIKKDTHHVQGKSRLEKLPEIF